MVRRCTAVSAEEVANEDDQFKDSTANWRRGRDDCHDPSMEDAIATDGG